MENDENIYGKPGIVVLSADYALNAQLQRRLQKTNHSIIGFYFVEDAIEWMSSQIEKQKVFIIDTETNGVSWKKTLQTFHANDIAIDAVILLEPDQHVSTREVKQHGAIGAFKKDETLFNVLPDKLDEIIKTIIKEHRQPAKFFNNDKSLKTHTYSDVNQTDENKVNESPAFTNNPRSECITLEEYKYKVQKITKDLEIQYNREQSFIIAYIGQEIKNAVIPIINMVRAVENTHLFENQQDLEAMHKATGDLVMLMNNLVDYANIETGKMEVVYHNFHLNAMVHDVINQLKHHTKENSATLQLTVKNNVPSFVYGDKLKLQQVLTNLTRYAIKKAQNTTIELMVQLSSEHADSLVFSVNNTGSDPAKNVIQSKTGKGISTSSKSIDAGIGLKTAQGLVYVMGGEMIIKKDLEDSFHAFFTIPVMESAVLEVSQDSNQEYGKPKRYLKVLLAEDDVINQMYLAGFLRAQGWDVDTAYNGLAVMELFEQEKYDLIILDGQMPCMDGFEAARKIRSSEANQSRTPILAISGYAIPGDKQKFLDAGMNDYIPKPINEDELLNVISKLTRK